MDDDDEAFEHDGKQGPKRRGCLVACLVLTLFTGVCTTGIFWSALQYRLRSSMTTFDTRLSLGPKAGAPKASNLREARFVLLRRLKDRGILARVKPGAAGEIDVDVLATDREEALEVLLAWTELRFMIVVGDEQLVAAQREIEIERIQAEQTAGTWSMEEARYAVYPWHADAATGSGSVLLDANWRVEFGMFERFERTLDSNGRACIGFTMSPCGRKALYKLTSENIGRQLAVILNGEVRSAPQIRGAIGKRGIIEGGRDGWDERELEDLLLLLNSGDMPFKVELLREKQLGP